jgi:hypothetical protein
MAGRQTGVAQTHIVDGAQLVSPGLREIGKGLVGQRILKDYGDVLKFR